jgi:hypothetical protein
MVHTPYRTTSPIPVMPDDNGNFDLDALLVESIQSQQDKLELAKNRKKLQATWLSDAEKKTLKADTEKLASRVEWAPVAAVAIFHTQRCVSCGTRHTHFMGVFQQQKQKTGGISGTVSAERWVRAVDSTMIDNLPKVQKLTDEPVDMCECCAVSLGFPPQLFA